MQDQRFDEVDASEFLDYLEGKVPDDDPRVPGHDPAQGEGGLPMQESRQRQKTDSEKLLDSLRASQREIASAIKMVERRIEEEKR